MGVDVPKEVWKVVGGTRNGGIIVRTEKDNASPQDPVRLATGALIEALEHDEESGRVRYTLLSGDGPSSGWVATSVQGRELLARASQVVRKVRPSSPPRQLPARRAAGRAGSSDEEQEQAALERYGMQLAYGRAEQFQAPQPELHHAQATQPIAALEVSLRQGQAAPRKVGDMGVISFARRPGARRGGRAAPQQQVQQVAPAPVKEKEESLACLLCGLPCGDVGYTTQGDRLHAECAAQLALQTARSEDKARREKEAAQKRKCRLQYGIGWKAARIPRNSQLAAKWPVPKGTCSLVLSGPDRMVHLAPTGDPTTSVNLEYLALALKVRKYEGSEPLFSLDPKAAVNGPLDHSEANWQTKRFEPAWLGPTSVGEVMFQADVYLKELSMGEYSQPVVGMSSCLDMSVSEADNESWNAREWFVVRKASVQLDEDGVLTPCVEMGVEAREQFKGEKGMEDAPITRADHPLVKYAEAFTHYFDVIAERRSVVYHLRELAKASVLAKFLLEANVNMEEHLFDIADRADTVPEESMIQDVPQMWNKRCYSQIRVQDGGSIDMESSLGISTHGVYGGVEFGLDRFEIGAAAVSVSGVSTRVTPLSTARYVDQPHLVPFKGTGRAAARGVDLNLDAFNLSEAAQAAHGESVGSWGAGKQSAEPSAACGTAFWKHLGRDAPAVFAKEDAQLLRALFNPHLSDRREEGEIFIPPDTSREYVDRLSTLLQEEQDIKEYRQELFLSDRFVMDRPGPLFPSSWASSFEITTGREPEEPEAGVLHPRPDYMADVPRFRQVLESSAPAFDRRTEDGTRFRVYTVGSLQVRTIQHYDGDEEIRAFFSTIAAAQEAAAPDGDWCTSEDNLVVRVTQLVETVESAGVGACLPEKVRRFSPSQLRFYVVLETELGDSIVMEKRGDQAAIWRENPAGLEARNSLARVTRSVDTSGTGITLRRFKSHGKSGDAPRQTSDGQRYAEEVYGLALAAWDRSWDELSGPQAEAVKALGVGSVAEWFEGRAQVFRTPWQNLSSTQLEAVATLGFDEDAWAEMVAWSQEREPAAGQWQRSGPAPRGPALAN